MHATRCSLLAAILLALTTTVLTEAYDNDFVQWQHRSNSRDLLTFVTRPDLNPPKLKVTLNKRDRTPPGYLFLAPYEHLESNHVPSTVHATQQIGPHIYTQDGELIWSGIDLFPGTRVFNFKPVIINGDYHLSLVSPPDAKWQPYPNGVAMVLNASYHPVFSVTSAELGKDIDMHDFQVLKDGQTALIATSSYRHTRESDKLQWQGEIRDCSFVEFDMLTGKRNFEWTASEHVTFTETSNPPPTTGSTEVIWDWFHLDSLDKDMFGNYLVSARSTNTIYYISPDGSVLWRLGGPGSSFRMDFTFSRQHHARIRDQNEVNMVISFIDNAADDTGRWKPTSEVSSLLVVGLDLVNRIATLYHRHDRPDGRLSRSSGNIQFLPNGGVFAGWGENGYMSEYINRGGEKLYEASFASTRFQNYRAYKMQFIGQPLSVPDVKSFVSTNARAQLRTAIYVSWNGATEVATWRFYSHSSSEKNIEIGQVAKSGFETKFIAMGYHPIIFAEALNSFGEGLANSSLAITDLPSGFHSLEDPSFVDDVEGKQAIAVDLVLRTSVGFVVGLAVASVWSRFRTMRSKSGSRGPVVRWRPKSKQ